jgi:hypothetical protein
MAIRAYLPSTCFVLAIDLANNNSLLWKVKVSEEISINLRIPLGQYPILMRDNEPRILFAITDGITPGTTRGGVCAIGNLSSHIPHFNADNSNFPIRISFLGAKHLVHHICLLFNLVFVVCLACTSPFITVFYMGKGSLHP